MDFKSEARISKHQTIPNARISDLADAVQVWRIPLDSVDCERLIHHLSPDELERAGGFHFPQDRDRFIARRGVLREVLGRYVGQTPGDLHLEYTSFGKPYLPGTPLHFSASHSSGLALYAISSRQVGVDLEYLRPDFPFRDIARRFFREDEIAYLDSLPASDQHRAFFMLWTRKEAYLKALGLGLSESLNTPNIPLTGEARIVGPDDSTWTLTDLEVDTDYSAALISMGDRQSIRLFR